jgi:flagellin
MTVINTNVKSLISQNALIRNNRAVETAMEQLSTGKRINSAADDAAGMAISNRISSQIRGLEQAVRNANDGISLIQTVEGSLNEVNSMLQRMRELAIQSANDTNKDEDRVFMNMEFQELKAEINRIGNNTQWNSTNIMDKSFADSTGEFKFQVGANSDQTIDLIVGDFRTNNGSTGEVGNTLTRAGDSVASTKVSQINTLTLSKSFREGDKIEISDGTTKISYEVLAEDLAGNAAENLDAIAEKLADETTLTGVAVAKGSTSGTITLTGPAAGTAKTYTITVISPDTDLDDIDASDILSLANSNLAIDAIDKSLSFVNTARAEMGATINRLTYAADNLINVSQNSTEARSRILDTDFAKASSELARTQIISQAATSVLAQANQSQQSVLKLLQG